MPDANKENTLNQLVGAAFGAAGQRCMALSTAILVGEARAWLPELVERAKDLRVNAGTVPRHPALHFCLLGPCCPKGLWFCHFGATHSALTTPLAFGPVVFYIGISWERGLVESPMLQICGQTSGPDLNSGSENQSL